LEDDSKELAIKALAIHRILKEEHGAAIVLLFSFNRPVFPVDTHVHRLSRRLGLIGPKVSREKAHDLLEALLPPDTYYAFHLNLITHGRRVCHARRPRCEGCPLLPLCDYGQEVMR